MTGTPIGGAPPAAGPPRTPIGGQLWLAAGVGLVCGLIVYGISAPLSRAVGLGLVVAATGFVLLRALEVLPAQWPEPPPGLPDRAARIQRWRLNGFDAMGDRNPGLSPHLQSRLQALASAQLARRGLAPGSAAAAALLGQGPHDLLFPPPAEQLPGRPLDPTSGQLAEMVDRLIELAADRVRAAPLPGRSEVSLTKGQR